MYTLKNIIYMYFRVESYGGFQLGIFLIRDAKENLSALHKLLSFYIQFCGNGGY